MTKPNPPIHSEGHYVLQERQKIEAELQQAHKEIDGLHGSIDVLTKLLNLFRTEARREKMRSSSRAGRMPRD